MRTFALAFALVVVGLAAAVAPPARSSTAFRYPPEMLQACDPPASPEPAADVPFAIIGTKTVPPHKLARLDVVGVPAGAAVVWDVSPDDICDIEEKGTGLVLTGPPGVYKVTATMLALVDGKTQAKRIRHVLTVDKLDPTPPAAPPDKEKKSPPSPDKKAEPRKALLKLSVGSSGCTATVVAPRRADGRWDILTASHCLGSATKGTVKTQDGRTLRVTKTAQDRKADICWLVTDEPVEDLPFAILATERPPANTPVWHSGYGVDKPFNVETGRFVGGPTPDGMYKYMLSVSPGDSGGGIFREDTGELLGPVCCTAGLARFASMSAGTSIRAAELRPKS